MSNSIFRLKAFFSVLMEITDNISKKNRSQDWGHNHDTLIALSSPCVWVCIFIYVHLWSRGIPGAKNRNPATRASLSSIRFRLLCASSYTQRLFAALFPPCVGRRVVVHSHSHIRCGRTNELSLRHPEPRVSLLNTKGQNPREYVWRETRDSM